MTNSPNSSDFRDDDLYEDFSTEDIGYIKITPVAKKVWPEASYPPTPLRSNAGPQDWLYSPIIWLRLLPVIKNVLGVEKEVEPARTILGRCVWPKVPAAFHPITEGIDNPSCKVEWNEGDYFYEALGRLPGSYPVPLQVSHWHPCEEPLPPGAPQPALEFWGTQSNTINTVDIRKTTVY